MSVVAAGSAAVAAPARLGGHLPTKEHLGVGVPGDEVPGEQAAKSSHKEHSGESDGGHGKRGSGGYLICYKL